MVETAQSVVDHRGWTDPRVLSAESRKEDTPPHHGKVAPTDFLCMRLLQKSTRDVCQGGSTLSLRFDISFEIHLPSHGHE